MLFVKFVRFWTFLPLVNDLWSWLEEKKGETLKLSTCHVSDMFFLSAVEFSELICSSIATLQSVHHECDNWYQFNILFITIYNQSTHGGFKSDHTGAQRRLRLPEDIHII